MPPSNSHQDASSRSAIRRRVGRFMVTGGVLGWGVILCVVAGAVSPQDTWIATAWFIAAFFVMLVLLGCLIKGYRLEDKYNPNFDPRERANREPEPQSTPGNRGNK